MQRVPCSATAGVCPEAGRGDHISGGFGSLAEPKLSFLFGIFHFITKNETGMVCGLILKFQYCGFPDSLGHPMSFMPWHRVDRAVPYPCPAGAVPPNGAEARVAWGQWPQAHLLHPISSRPDGVCLARHPNTQMFAHDCSVARPPPFILDAPGTSVSPMPMLCVCA